MGQTTLSTQNAAKPAPKWFRKLKTATGYIVDGVLTFMLATGHTENSVTMLALRIGYGRLMSALEALLANGEDYKPSDDSQLK